MLIAQRPTLSEESISEFRSRFVIEPLEPGFGYTLGNSLRRTLLSSIPGAAVTSIRIDNIQHEFATIPGVKEDVVEIVLNIKNLVVSSEHLISNFADVPSVRALADGSLLAHWIEMNGPDPEAYDLKISSSRDGGKTWSAAASPHTR